MTSAADMSPPSSPQSLQATRSGKTKSANSTIVSRSRSPVQSATRPGLHPQRPSWVGPPAPSRPTTPGIFNMTQKVRVSYSHAGLQPPVYIAGSLGDQPWEPVELQYTRHEDGEHEFWKEFELEEGEYQYKFRLGPGDWWALDESKHIVDDGAGNRNNLLVVKPQPQQDNHASDVASVSASAQAPEHSDNDINHPIPAEVEDADHHSSHHHHPVAPAHIQEAEPVIPVIQEPESNSSSADASDNVSGDAEQAPAFEHEAANGLPVRIVTSFPQDHEEHAPFFRHETAATNDPTELEVEEDDEDYDDGEVASPLLRHESLTPIHTNHVQDGDNGVPLFRHESMSPIISARSFSSSHSARSNSASSHDPNPFDDNDLNDPSLERFPTERDDIMAHLHRASSRLPENDSAIDADSTSPTLSATRSLSAGPSPSLSVPRESNDHLDCIDEDEELSPEDPATKRGLGIKSNEGSVLPATPASHDSESAVEDKQPSSKVSTSSSHEPVNRGPLTPPMTPIDELQAKGSAFGGSSDVKRFDLPSKVEASKSDSLEAKSTDSIASSSSSKPASASAGGKDGKANTLWDWIGKVCGTRISTLGIAMAVGVAAAFYAMTGQTSST